MHETSAPVRPSLRCDTLEAVRLPAAEAMFGATIRASAASMNSLRVIACRLADSMPERSHPGVSRARSSWPSSTQVGPRSDSESPETVLALSSRLHKYCDVSEARCPDRAHSSSSFRLANAGCWKRRRGRIRHRIVTWFEQRSRSMLREGSATTRLPFGSIRLGRSSASGASASSRRASLAWRSDLAAGGRLAFPPSVVVAVKALACELPHEHELPLSRLRIPDIRREAVRRGLVASIGDTTLWRWLAEDAIRPWAHRSWIFPRAPDFKEKAERVVQLYEGLWRGKKLGAGDFVISADEKTSIQAL